MNNSKTKQGCGVPRRSRLQHTLVSALTGVVILAQTATAWAAPTYQYNSLNQLVESRLDDGTVVKNFYDGAGNLSKQTINGQTRYLIQDDSGGLSRLLGWEDHNGDTVKIIHGPGGPVAEHNPENGSLTQYYLKDHLGSVRGMLDFRGDMEGRTFYDPYGKVTGTSSEQPALGYTGEYTDESKLVYLRARHYNPQLGRFMQKDPFTGFAGRTMSQNPYAYAEHNPMNYTDPGGNAVGLLTIAAITIALYVIDQALVPDQVLAPRYNRKEGIVLVELGTRRPGRVAKSISFAAGVASGFLMGNPKTGNAVDDAAKSQGQRLMKTRAGRAIAQFLRTYQTGSNQQVNGLTVSKR